MKSRALFLITCSLLLVYSFSQVDLNLTLSSNFNYQAFQKQLTLLGYFNRPLSTAVFIIIILLFIISYLSLISYFKTKSSSQKKLWILAGLAVIILLPSYPAFSHDIFNYLFDARIVTKYGLSPWHYKALDFPQDNWIRFMRWTHRLTPYPPLWIALSLIPSYLGFGKFIVTLGLFKLMAASAYLASVNLILKISKKIGLKKPLLIAGLFAFNPAVIIESLVNAHIEITLIFFALLSLYLYFAKKKYLAWLSLLASVGVKVMTAYLGLVLLKGKSYLKLTIYLGIILTIIFSLWRGFQPWYVLWVFPFSLLLSRHGLTGKLINIASISALFWYVPKISRGDFNLPDPGFRLLYIVIPFLILSIPTIFFKRSWLK